MKTIKLIKSSFEGVQFYIPTSAIFGVRSEVQMNLCDLKNMTFICLLLWKSSGRILNKNPTSHLRIGNFS